MPILAEIADKMPSLKAMWQTWLFIGLFMAVVTAGISFARLWVGGVVVVLSAGFGLLTAWPDGIMDSAIVQELGAGYLLQQRVSGFVPFVLALCGWAVVVCMRRPNKALQATAALPSC